MNVKKIAIGSDHAGFATKMVLVNMLQGAGYEVLDLGTDSGASVDYPDFIHPVADVVEGKHAELGIILCGSGNGAAMTANKHQGIRAAIAWTAELSALARLHNNANILTVPARFVSEELAKEMVQVFLETDFEGGRHERRVNKIALKDSSFSSC